MEVALSACVWKDVVRLKEAERCIFVTWTQTFASNGARLGDVYMCGCARVCVRERLTVLLHAEGHAALQSAVLAAVAVVLIDHTLPRAAARVHEVLADASLEKAFAAFAAHCPVVTTFRTQAEERLMPSVLHFPHRPSIPFYTGCESLQRLNHFTGKSEKRPK